MRGQDLYSLRAVELSLSEALGPWVANRFWVGFWSFGGLGVGSLSTTSRHT